VLKVDRPGFDSMAELGQKTLRIGIHSVVRLVVTSDSFNPKSKRSLRCLLVEVP